MKPYQICGLGNAIVDIFVEVSDTEFAALGFERGTMRLVEPAEQKVVLERFRDHLGLADVALPVEVPPLDIYLSWHYRTHRHAAHTWFREQVVQSLEPSPQGI